MNPIAATPAKIYNLDVDSLMISYISVAHFLQFFDS